MVAGVPRAPRAGARVSAKDAVEVRPRPAQLTPRPPPPHRRRRRRRPRRQPRSRSRCRRCRRYRPARPRHPPAPRRPGSRAPGRLRRWGRLVLWAFRLVCDGWVDCVQMIARSRAIPLSHHTQQRLLEILPGALTWFALLVPVVAAFAIRLNDPGMLWILGLGAVLLDAYWLVRTTVTVRGVRKTLKALQATEAVDWWQRCEDLEATLPERAPKPSEVVQCALIPTYTESYDILHATVAALAAQNYPAHLRVCAIITRETDAGGIENVDWLREEFASSFRLFLHIRDPLLPGIVVGKSAAMAYGGPVLKAACDELGLDPSRTMVTDLDSDFRLHPQYFAYVTLQFCRAEDRLVSIWQPVPVFLNNIWRGTTAVMKFATAATRLPMFLAD